MTYNKVRRTLVAAGVHHIQYEKVSDGCAKCLKCERVLPVKMFWRLGDGIYKCRDCDTKQIHSYTIQRVGCSPEQYTKMLEGQGGVCAICGANEGHRSKHNRACKLAVDHDHVSGRVRGLLCGRCNRGLGWFRDSPELLEKAIRYLSGVL